METEGLKVSFFQIKVVAESEKILTFQTGPWGYVVTLRYEFIY